MLRRLAFAVVPLVLLVSALAACTESASIPPAEPSSAVEPLFATDEEALEAATVAYEEYLRASNVLTSQPGADPAAVRSLVTDEYWLDIEMSLEQLEGQGLRTDGSTLLRSSTLQQHFEDEGGSTTVIYVCLDVSGVRVLDAAGADQTPADRELLVGLELELVGLRINPGALLVARSEAWGQGEVCE